MEETLGKRISAGRKRLGMTQDKLAETLGVTAQAVSKWENDQSCPDISMLPNRCQFLLRRTDRPCSPDASGTIYLTADANFGEIAVEYI